MTVRLKIAELFNPAEERLPKKTGIGGKLKPIKTEPLFQPENTISGNAVLKAQLGMYKSTNPKEIRQSSMERLSRAVDKINNYIRSSITHKGLLFSVDEKSNRNVAYIRDRDTGEVLKEIPPEGALQIAANLRRASGLFVNRKG